jgi:hypothetical protein
MVDKIGVRNLPRGRLVSTPDFTPSPGSQPSLAALTARFLDRQSRDPGPDPDWCSTGVEPHEAASGFRTDARMTWAEAVTAITVGGAVTVLPPSPAAWGVLTRQLPARFAVALCVGNYPQLLGDVSRLVSEPDLSRLAGRSESGDHQVDASGLRPADRGGKSDREFATLLTAAGHRLSGDFAAADKLLSDKEPENESRWRAVWENERAAVLWESGQLADALAAWRNLPDGAIKAYNLGMAELFTGHPERAKPHLTSACALLPESSGWNHMARLYLTLCDQAA